jgi:hypothetical protein
MIFNWAGRTCFKQSSQVKLLLSEDVSGSTNALAEEGWWKSSCFLVL